MEDVIESDDENEKDLVLFESVNKEIPLDPKAAKIDFDQDVIQKFLDQPELRAYKRYSILYKDEPKTKVP